MHHLFQVLEHQRDRFQGTPVFDILGVDTRV
jgi:hypothetical protein